MSDMRDYREKWERLAEGYQMAPEGRKNAEIAKRLIMEGRQPDEIVSRLNKLTGHEWRWDHIWTLLMMGLSPEDRAQVWDAVEKYKDAS